MLQNCDSSIGNKFQKTSGRAYFQHGPVLPALNCVRDDVPGRSGKTNGMVIAAKCAPAEGENFPGKKQAGAKLNMPV
jgi:hypothetical protein